MGYTAKGGGYIVVSEMNEEIKNSLEREFEFDVWDQKEDGSYDIELWAYGKYYETGVGETLQNIAPYTIDGEIMYYGEDDCIWRFVFDKETKCFQEEPGDIVFWTSIRREDIPDDAFKRLCEEDKNLSAKS